MFRGLKALFGAQHRPDARGASALRHGQRMLGLRPTSMREASATSAPTQRCTSSSGIGLGFPLSTRNRQGKGSTIRGILLLHQESRVLYSSIPPAKRHPKWNMRSRIVVGTLNKWWLEGSTPHTRHPCITSLRAEPKRWRLNTTLSWQQNLCSTLNCPKY